MALGQLAFWIALASERVSVGVHKLIMGPMSWPSDSSTVLQSELNGSKCTAHA